MDAAPDSRRPAAPFDAVACLQAHGIRLTTPRLRIAELLLGSPRHRSAEQVTEALRRGGIRISKATVYNTLNLFAMRGLLRELAVDPHRAWFDSNTDPHFHFLDVGSGTLSDVARDQVRFESLPEPPPGMEVESVEVVIRVRPR